MSTRIVGTCGNCGGPVEVPHVWMGIYPPTPQCRHCHATPQNAFGPRLPMNPRPVAQGYVERQVDRDLDRDVKRGALTLQAAEKLRPQLLVAKMRETFEQR